jgi:NAD(P)-dependent dehydrogenase (short-subunit alcohol dehydrogenase family)
MDRDVAVVIGSGGMGIAIARRIGGGRRLLLADVSATVLAAAAEQLTSDGHDVTTRVVDVSDQTSVASLAAAAAALGRVTHVAHTAGLSPVQAPVAAILRVDLVGVAYVLDAFAGVVAPGGAGVVIASMAGHMAGALPPEMEAALASTPAAHLLALPFLTPEAVPNAGAAYTIAKRANALRVQAAAGAWGSRGARINTISPGVISTSMGQQELDGASGEQMRGMIAMSGMGRIGTPDDIADAAGFLLGPGASFITGTDLLVDGGVIAAIRSMQAQA